MRVGECGAGCKEEEGRVEDGRQERNSLVHKQVLWTNTFGKLG